MLAVDQVAKAPDGLAEDQSERADVEAARIDAENAESNDRRMKTLAEQHFISTQQADDARAKSDAAKARYASLQETLKLVQQGPRKEDIAAAKATQAANEAALAVARRDVAEAELHAPSAGVIESRVLEPGDMASPQKPVYTLALTDPLWVRVYVPETDLGRIRPGGVAGIGTDSHPGRRYRGWVGYISPSAEFTPKSVETREVRTTLVDEVRVFVCAPADGLRLGLPFERVDIGGEFGGNDQPAYLAMNPNGRVPTIQDKGLTLWESNVIVRYLAHTYGNPGLQPADRDGHWIAEQWMDWQQTAANPAMNAMFWGHVRTEPDKDDPAAIEASRAKSEACAAILDAHLATRRFLTGERFTAADIVVGCATHRWLNMPLGRVRRPNLERYYEELSLRPAARQVVSQPMH